MARTKQPTPEDAPVITKRAAASDNAASSTKVTASKSKQATSSAKSGGVFRPFKAIGSYFSGSWRELRQTKWPTRRATWGLTTAVIFFTAVLMLFIVAIDYVFELLFKKIIL